MLTIYDQLNKISEYINLVKKGVLPCYRFVLKGPEEDIETGLLDFPSLELNIYKQINAIKEIIEKAELYLFTEEYLDLTDSSNHKHYWCWIYKYPHQKKILEKLPHIQDDYLENWIIASLLGYSLDAIETYLTNLNSSKK